VYRRTAKANNTEDADADKESDEYEIPSGETSHPTYMTINAPSEAGASVPNVTPAQNDTNPVVKLTGDDEGDHYYITII